jgi:hypothetical protein
MKKIILLFFILTAVFQLNGQDIITKKSGEEIQSKIIEITTSEVKYKKYDNLGGPIYSILKNEVFFIKYENGTKEVINTLENNNKSNNTAQDLDPCLLGEQDADLNYRGQNSGATWTGLITVLTSPLIGLIPAVACTLTEPNVSNLGITDFEKIAQPQYKKCYTEKAHKIKKKKVWQGFAIGSAIWIPIILAL